MAEELTVKGAPVKVRDPWAPVLLPIITLGIYHLVWYYMILSEMKAVGDRVGDEQLKTINPTRAVLALFPGFILLGIPTLISYIKSAQHVERTREVTGDRSESLAYLWFVLVPYVGSAIVEYMVQQRLNRAWHTGSGSTAIGTGTPAPSSPVITPQA